MDFNYIQTSLDENKSPVECLDLCVIIIKKSLQNKYIEKNKVIKFLEDYTKYSLNKDININEELAKMKNELEHVEYISLSKLI